MTNRICFLPERGVIKMTGEETQGFLHRLITNSVKDIAPGESRFSALLSPQGKLMFDFFVAPLPDGEPGFLIDCVRDQSAALAQRLNFHKLRAKITIEDQSEALGVAAILDDEAPVGIDGVIYSDARAPGLGRRIIAAREALASASNIDAADYESRRVAAGVPKGGVDFIYGDAFVQDFESRLVERRRFQERLLCRPGSRRARASSQIGEEADPEVSLRGRPAGPRGRDRRGRPAARAGELNIRLRRPRHVADRPPRRGADGGSRRESGRDSDRRHAPRLSAR